jgi:hypothetical protein
VATRLPLFTAEQSVRATAGSPRGSRIVAQQFTFDPNTLTVTYCLPCFWGRRRCCGYTHGGDLRCWSGPC